MNKTNSNAIISIFTIILIIIVGTIFANSYLNNKEIIDKNKCEAIDIQKLHNDYDDNEITAKEKYANNLYYFSGEIHDISEFLNDKYIVLRYTSSRNQSKIIEITAYFDNADDLKNVKKGDLVTIYGKFKDRSIENYMNTITSYSFKSCLLEKNQ